MFWSVRLMLPLVPKEMFLAGAFQKGQVREPNETFSQTTVQESEGGH